MLDVRLPLDRSIVALLASFVPIPFLAWWKGRDGRGIGGGGGRKGDAEFGIQKHMEAVRVHRQDLTGLDLIQAHLRW